MTLELKFKSIVTMLDVRKKDRIKPEQFVFYSMAFKQISNTTLCIL